MEPLPVWLLKPFRKSAFAPLQSHHLCSLISILHSSSRTSVRSSGVGCTHGIVGWYPRLSSSSSMVVAHTRQCVPGSGRRHVAVVAAWSRVNLRNSLHYHATTLTVYARSVCSFGEDGYKMGNPAFSGWPSCLPLPLVLALYRTAVWLELENAVRHSCRPWPSKPSSGRSSSIREWQVNQVASPSKSLRPSQGLPLTLPQILGLLQAIVRMARERRRFAPGLYMRQERQPSV